MTGVRLSEKQVVQRVESVSHTRLRAWVRSGWVRPASSDDGHVFSDADVARVRLIRELHDELDVDEDAVPVILSLIDQIHGLRRELRMLGSAVEEQPGDVRRAVAEAFRRLSDAE